MALPIQNAAVYTATVPSTKQEIKFRAFLVKEEKALLIAQQSEDPTVMMDTLKQIIKSCVRTELDVETLALFDIEYIFAQLRSKSVGEIVEIVVACDVCPDEDTKARVKLTQEAAAPAATPTPAAPVIAKKISITCIKGKTSKKVTAVNPMCPKGYKKK
jgi:hypothetical protein